MHAFFMQNVFAAYQLLKQATVKFCRACTLASGMEELNITHVLLYSAGLDLHHPRLELGTVAITELFLDPHYQIGMYNEKHFAAPMTDEILELIS